MENKERDKLNKRKMRRFYKSIITVPENFDPFSIQTLNDRLKANLDVYSNFELIVHLIHQQESTCLSQSEIFHRLMVLIH